MGAGTATRTVREARAGEGMVHEDGDIVMEAGTAVRALERVAVHDVGESVNTNAPTAVAAVKWRESERR